MTKDEKDAIEAVRRLSSQMGVESTDVVGAYARLGDSIRAAHDELMKTHPLYRERMAWLEAPWCARIWWRVTGRKKRLDNALKAARGL